MPHRRNKSAPSKSRRKIKLVPVAGSAAIGFLLATLVFVSLNPTPQQRQGGDVTQQITVAFDEEILHEEAVRQGIRISDDEVNAFIDESLEFYNINRSQLNQLIAVSNTSKDEYEADIRKRLMVSELINRNVDFSSATVTDEEVDSFMQKYQTELEQLISTRSYPTVREQVQRELLEQKQTDLVLAYAQTLKDR